MKYLRTAKISEKKVLVRVDFNVPVHKGLVLDDFRIEKALPTIKHLIASGNKVIICGHLGRPEGKMVSELSLRPVAKVLAHLLNLEFLETDKVAPASVSPRLIFYTGKILEDKHQKAIASFPPSDVVVLENLRFYSGEDANEAVFAKKLASLADVYVNDAFGVDHRKAASTFGIVKYLPSYCGLLLEKEIKSLDEVLKRHKKPFVLLLGGIKISDKVQTLENLGKKADKILLSGGLANLFFLAKGFEIGKSKVEVPGRKIAWALEKNFKGKIVLPLDVVVANEHMDRDSIRVAEPHMIKPKEKVLDVGPKTILAYARELKAAKTIVWNGPLGYFEKKPFHTATIALARVIGGVASRKAFVLVGGGETVDAVRLAYQLEHIDHVSTGGGAMLEYLAGKKLPGIEALKQVF